MTNFYKITTFICLFLYSHLATGQKNFNNYFQAYPMGEDPDIRFISSYRPEEKILFEANPNVRFSVYNNFLKGLTNGRQHTQAWYVLVKPQLRMYTSTSLPVKTPSYRVLLGTQHLFRLPFKKNSSGRERFLGFSLESGHYSNGQSGCAFSKDFDDGSAQCDSIYRLITSSTDLSKILNRESGNFSTNLTEFIFNYRIYKLDDDNVPTGMNSISIGAIFYHDRFLGVANFGGYSDMDIKIYGRTRYLAKYEYFHVFKHGEGTRLAFKQNFEWIQKPHSSVEPFRTEATITYFPFVKSKALGFFAGYIYGHDNYNFRFVDSGHQFSAGLTWSQFPPFAMTNRL